MGDAFFSSALFLDFMTTRKSLWEEPLEINIQKIQRRINYPTNGSSKESTEQSGTSVTGAELDKSGSQVKEAKAISYSLNIYSTCLFKLFGRGWEILNWFLFFFFNVLCLIKGLKKCKKQWTTHLNFCLMYKWLLKIKLISQNKKTLDFKN